MKYKSYILSCVAALALVGCSDTWDDHYEGAQTQGTENLLTLIQSDSQLSDFVKLLQSTHLYNNQHSTKVTYADLLASDQTLTVWAPVNGTYNADSLLALCQTQKGDSSVAQHFVSNHISRNLYNMNSGTDDDVKMLNDKFITLTPTTLGESKVDANGYNIGATNGILHKLTDDAQYYYNIYEGITSMPQYSYIGNYILKFEKQELNDTSSIVAGIEDGRKVYSDSVMYKDNSLFRVFDYIDSEDSSFVMLAPSKEVWEPVYNEAVKYYDYGSIAKADSISGYWTNVALVQDLIFNRNVQHSSQDSIFSTSYSKKTWPYHVYYKPFSDDGVITRASIIDSVKCSNGVIYNIGTWPFDIKDLYFHPIVAQGENEAIVKNRKDCTFNIREVNSDLISGHGYVDIVPAKSTSNWTATFEIANTLSGTYDICAVTLPKTVYLSNSKDKKPNKFVASISYVDKEGVTRTEDYDTPVLSSGTDIDTLKIGRFTFPTCNYGQPDATVTVTLKCSISTRETKYSREMFLDCIYLRPVTEQDMAEEEANESKSRKEVRK